MTFPPQVDIVVRHVEDAKAKGARVLVGGTRGRKSDPAHPGYWFEPTVLVDVFFFSSRRRHTRSLHDWSSDVCSSDLRQLEGDRRHVVRPSRVVAEVRGPAGGVGGVPAAAEQQPLDQVVADPAGGGLLDPLTAEYDARSEERRVGEERRTRWSGVHDVR